MRALITLRISRDKDESTTLERHEGDCRDYAAAQGWTVVGVAEDADVSGGGGVFERPVLGEWLKHPDRFDVIITARHDRLTRSIYESRRFELWCSEHGIRVVSATEDNKDRMSRDIRALVGEWELEAIAARTAARFDDDIRRGVYRGGNPPFGYRPERIDGEWRYVPDEVMAPLAKSIALRIINGEPLTRIVRELNNNGTPTPSDHHRGTPGKTKWTTTGLRIQLKRETLMGYAMRSDPMLDVEGKPRYKVDAKGRRRKIMGPVHVIYGPDGAPVQRAEPILSPGDFERLQEALAGRSGPPQRARVSSMLTGLVTCGVCGRKMYRHDGGRYYKCDSVTQGGPCGNRMAPLAKLDEFVSGTVLQIMSDRPLYRRVYNPGSGDPGKQLADIDAQLTALANAVSRFPAGSPAYDAMLGQVDQLTAQRNKITAQPVRPAGVEWVATGQGFSEFWQSASLADRNLWLKDHSVSLVFGRNYFTHSEFRGLPSQARRVPGSIDLDFGDLPAMLAEIDPVIAQHLETPGFREWFGREVAAL